MGTVHVSVGDRVVVTRNGESEVWRVTLEAGHNNNVRACIERQLMCVACGDNEVDVGDGMCPYCVGEACYAFALRDALFGTGSRLARSMAAMTAAYGSDEYPASDQAWARVASDAGDDCVVDMLDNVIAYGWMRMRAHLNTLGADIPT